MSGAQQQSGDSKETVDDWRKAVPQSYRSAEVREVAKVLAALEPGATSQSKLMLAMRFEDTIFQGADSLADYRKRLTKRLKKVQKSYKPQAPDDPQSAATKAREREIALEKELRLQYGDALKFIVDHATEAVKIMGEKHGQVRADHLRQHTDNAEQWAVELSVVDETQTSRRKKVPREAGFLDRLKLFLEQRVDNIRGHVVKLVRPDAFLGETLAKLEDDMDAATAYKLAAAAQRVLTRIGQPIPSGGAEELRQLLERATVPVPAPRGRNLDVDVREACLSYLDRTRVASQAVLAFVSMDRDERALLKDVLKKSHGAAVEGLEFLEKNYVARDESGKKKVVLEDAWMKVLEFPPSDEDVTEALSMDGANADRTGGHPPPKRRRMVISTKVLLAPGRKTPSSLLPALEAKKAKLLRRDDCGAGARLRMEFGDAFEMTVYFQPLLVTIRAMTLSNTGSVNGGEKLPVKREGENNYDKHKSEFLRFVVDGNLPTWTDAEYGLTSTSSTLGLEQAFVGKGEERRCTVSGVPGPIRSLSPIVAKKLEYASARATSVLRRCFADLAGKTQASSDFEVEISEATALLKFLQIARSTYPCDGDD